MTHLHALKKNIDAGAIAELYVPLQPGKFSASDTLFYIYKQDAIYIIHVRLRGQHSGNSTTYSNWHMLSTINEPLLLSNEWNLCE